MLNFILAFLVLTSTAFAGLSPEAREAWGMRNQKEELQKALRLMETLPEDREVLSHLSRGHFLMGEFFTKDDDKEKVFEKAKAFGEKGLELNPEYKKLKDKDIEKAIATLKLEDIDSLYWAAASLGKWAKARGIMSSLGYKNQILAMIRKVGSLNPDYFYGAVDRYLGGFYAIAPGIAGGDMDKSKKHFERGMEKAPENLGTKVFYAEVYLTKEDKEKEFEKVLNEVLAAPNGPAEITPENILEKGKAADLLSKKSKLF